MSSPPPSLASSHTLEHFGPLAASIAMAVELFSMKGVADGARCPSCCGIGSSQNLTNMNIIGIRGRLLEYVHPLEAHLRCRFDANGTGDGFAMAASKLALGPRILTAYLQWVVSPPPSRRPPPLPSSVSSFSSRTRYVLIAHRTLCSRRPLCYRLSVSSAEPA